MKKKIGVIGSSEKGSGHGEKAEELGREIAKSGCQLLTGGCTGLPYAAVKGAKSEGGFTLGISPATDRKEHLERYNYPIEKHDSMVYTGFGYKGRNVILVRSCDAVIAIGGRFGTLNELTIAYSEDKVIGIMEGTSGAAGECGDLAERIGRPNRTIISSEDAEELVETIIQAVKKKG